MKSSEDNFFTKDKNTYDNLIFDTNLWFHRNYHAHGELKQEVGGKMIVTGGIWGFLQTLERMKRDYLKEEGHIYFLFDNADSKLNMRRELYDPQYKSGRKQYPTSFYRSLDYLRLILLDYGKGMSVVYGTGFEADDLLPPLLNKIDKEESVLLVSEDLDWARAINYNGRPVYQYRNKKIYGKKEFNEEFDFLPTEKKVVLYKTIRGDKSDEIPVGLPKFPKKKLVRLVDDFEDIFDVLTNLNSIPYLTEDWKRKIKENEARLRLNHQLVSYIPISDSYLEDFMFECKHRPMNLKILYESLGFNTQKGKQKQIQEEKLKEKESSKRGFEFKKPKISRE